MKWTEALKGLSHRKVLKLQVYQVNSDTSNLQRNSHFPITLHDAALGTTKNTRAMTDRKCPFMYSETMSQDNKSSRKPQ